MPYSDDNPPSLVWEKAEWKADAACRGLDPNLFFADRATNIKPEARAVCYSCKVQTECLLYAIRNGERIGMWGGLTDKNIRPLRSWYVFNILRKEDDD